VALVGVHGTQVFVVGEQRVPAGFPAQSGSPRHCTQTPSGSLQFGVGAVHAWLFPQPEPEPQVPTSLPPATAVHCSPLGHVPPVPLGRQPGTQDGGAPVQMSPEPGPPQSPSLVQPHVPVEGRHVGVGCVQRLPFVGEHGVHEPASGPEV
jgi:hypothetical protein